jgi:hypothetical protein
MKKAVSFAELRRPEEAKAEEIQTQEGKRQKARVPGSMFHAEAEGTEIVG